MSLWSRIMSIFVRRECAADSARLDEAYRAAAFQQRTTTEAAKGARVASDHQRARIEVAREQIQRRIAHASTVRPSPPTSEARAIVEMALEQMDQRERARAQAHRES